MILFNVQITLVVMIIFPFYQNSMLTVCNKKCLTAYGKDLDDYEKKCIDSCVDKFFDAQKEISLVMQNQQQ